MAKPDRLSEVDYYRNRAGRTYEVLNEALNQAGFTKGVSAFRGKLRVEGRGTQLVAEVRDLNMKEIRRRLEYNLSRLPLELRDKLDYLVPIINVFCFDDYHGSMGEVGALVVLRWDVLFSVVSYGALNGLPGGENERVAQLDELIQVLVAMDVIKVGFDRRELAYLTKKADPWLSVD